VHTHYTTSWERAGGSQKDVYNKAIKSEELTVLFENLEVLPWFEYGKGSKEDKHVLWINCCTTHTHTQKNTDTPHLPVQPDQDCLILYR